MARTHSFERVTPQAWEQLKAQTITQHGTRYEPPNANVGISTTGTVLGSLVLAFEFRPSVQHLTYTIRQKPMLVSESAIWSGIGSALDRCRS
jgi:hypothetical protein